MGTHHTSIFSKVMNIVALMTQLYSSVIARARPQLFSDLQRLPYNSHLALSNPPL
jgi:hypothetical protein